MTQDVSSELRFAVLNAALGVCLEQSNILSPAALSALSGVLREHLGFAGIAMLLPDGQNMQRLYVDVSDALAERKFDVGSQVPTSAALMERVYGQGKPYVSDDTSTNDPTELVAARVGFGSYVALPLIAGAGSKPEGALIWLYRERGQASAAPLPLLVEVTGLLARSFERALRLARERRLAKILETSSDAMLAWDQRGIVTDANQAACKLVGMEREALLGYSIRELLDPAPDPSHAVSPPDTRIVLITHDEKGRRWRIPVAATMTAIEDDPLVACHVILRDLTAWEASEREVVAHLERIRVLEEQHRTLLDNAPLVIFRLDPNTRELVYLNHCAERLLGVPTDEALRTRGFLRGLHVEHDALVAYDEAVARAKAGMRSSPYEARLQTSTGQSITARCTLYPLLGEDNELVAIEGILIDVSTEHAARTRLIQADRLSTLGTLAAGVAHEINNPAAFILLGLDMMARMLDGPGVELSAGISEQVHNMLAELRDSTRRIVDIVRDLRMFARAPAGTRRLAVDVNRTVESALSLTRGQIIERARVVRELGDVPAVLIDEGRLGQVLVNLLVNAAQAIPRNAPGEPTVTVTTRSDDERTVEIEVRDTGVGIPREIMSRIWDPFFTTKEPGAGTGLGLSISREIVERSGGRIYVESPIESESPPRGTRFVLVLPAARGGDSSIPPVPSTPPRSIRRAARVLVVEDEAPLARALSEEIGRTHEVTLAKNATDALVEIEKGVFDVILCDLRMPGMSGEAFYEKVLTEKPDVARRFVFMTGVGFGAEIERFLSGSGRPVLEKPFSAEDAIALIHKVFSRHGRAPERAR